MKPILWRVVRSTAAAAALFLPSVAVQGQSAPAGTSWPDDRAFPSFERATHLDVLQVPRLSPDEQLMVVTLQGLVNRRRPRIYLARGPQESRTNWLQILDVPHSDVADPMQLVSKYRDEIRGLVVYDPHVDASVNVATTLAGLDDAIVVGPDLATTLTTSQHFTVLEDLRGRFSDDMAAYNWEFDNLWPRTTHRMIVASPPKQHLFIRDYAVATKAMVVWLRVGVPAERDLLARIVDSMPPDTPYAGWFVSEPGSNEVPAVSFLSEHAKYNLAADLFWNATVFSGVPAPVARTQPAAPPVALGPKFYLTFTVSDGDNIQYDQNRMKMAWADPARGRVPINWTINPLLVDLAPSMLAYYQRTATPGDYLVAGPSGAGYAYPAQWPSDTFHLFTERTGRYMTRAGLRIIEVENFENVGRLRASPLGPEQAASFARDVAPLGIDLARPAAPVSVAAAGLPVAMKIGIKSVDDARQKIERVSAGWDGRTPRFLVLYADAWHMSPSDLAQIASSLGSQYQVVRGDQFFQLVRQALGLPAG